MGRAGWPGARALIKPYPLTDQPVGRINLTDPDSRNLKATRGWVQGYNAQAAVTQEQIVVAAEISIESLDTANLRPMVESAGTELNRAGLQAKLGVVLADAGYWKNEAIEALVGQGIQTLVAPTPTSEKSPDPAAAAVSMTSPARCWPPTGAQSYTSNAKARSSPCSARSRPTAAQTAAHAAAGRPSAPNGACWAPPTPPQAPPSPARRQLSPQAATEPSTTSKPAAPKRHRPRVLPTPPLCATPSSRSRSHSHARQRARGGEVRRGHLNRHLLGHILRGSQP